MYEVPYLSVRTLPPRYDPASAKFTFANCPPEPAYKRYHAQAEDHHEQAGDVGVDDLRFLVVRDHLGLEDQVDFQNLVGFHLGPR